jgi:hypothetical protein
MRKIYIIVLLLASVWGGCKKNIEILPESFITAASFFKTPDDAQAAVNGMYVRLRALANQTLYWWGESRSEMLTSGTAAPILARLYNNTLNVNDVGVNWAEAYQVIDAANLVIKYVPTITFASQDIPNDAIAQAYTMRAFMYFTLARTYGGVPVRTEPTEGYDPVAIQVGRTAEADVFKLVKEDLEKAIALYPNNTFSGTRSKWSKAGAYAVKADVYLWTGKRLNGGTADFTIALDALNEVQKADVGLLTNFADIFKYANKGNREIVMAIRQNITEGGNQTFAHNMYASHDSYPAFVPQSQKDIVGASLAGNGNVWRPSDIVRGQFTDDDTRKAATYIDMAGTGANQYYSSYGLKSSGTVNNGTRMFRSDYILYRYGDILLMKAEVKNALGQDPTAEMTLIRQRAYGANYSSHVFVNGTQAQNDAAILKERLLELALEGKRWWDLVRFGKAFELVPSLVGKSAQTHLLYWPVGTSTIQREPQVTEFPGWQL